MSVCRSKAVFDHQTDGQGPAEEQALQKQALDLVGAYLNAVPADEGNDHTIAPSAVHWAADGPNADSRAALLGAALFLLALGEGVRAASSHGPGPCHRSRH